VVDLQVYALNIEYYVNMTGRYWKDTDDTYIFPCHLESPKPPLAVDE
jgi:hypothetical protein